MRDPSSDAFGPSDARATLSVIRLITEAGLEEVVIVPGTASAFPQPFPGSVVHVEDFVVDPLDAEAASARAWIAYSY
jgi:hypothetical protein